MSGLKGQSLNSSSLEEAVMKAEMYQVVCSLVITFLEGKGVTSSQFPQSQYHALWDKHFLPQAFNAFVHYNPRQCCTLSQYVWLCNLSSFEKMRLKWEHSLTKTRLCVNGLWKGNKMTPISGICSKQHNIDVFSCLFVFLSLFKMHNKGIE